MPSPISPASSPIRFEGPKSTTPLAFRYYDKDRVVLGKRMEDHLRFAVCYWHTFCWHGHRRRSARGTFDRPWHRRRRSTRRRRGTKARRRVRLLHEARRAVLLLPRRRRGARRRDAAREPSSNFAAHGRPCSSEQQAATPACKLLWGTANLFSHPRFMPAAPPPTPIPRSSPAPPRRCATAWRRPSASAARTTCCGAAARATRRCSTPT